MSDTWTQASALSDALLSVTPVDTAVWPSTMLFDSDCCRLISASMILCVMPTMVQPFAGQMIWRIASMVSFAICNILALPE